MMTLLTFPTDQSLSPANYRQTVADFLAKHVHLGCDNVFLQDALGQVLADDILAPISLPSFANSQMDGYTLTTTAATRANRVFTIGADIAAGAAPENLVISDDIAYPIMTGAPLPAGYTAVVPVERSQLVDGTPDAAGFGAARGQVKLPTIEPGTFVRQIGEDIQVGSLLAAAGQEITPALLGSLASQGIGQVAVLGRPRLLLITGGDELLPQAGLVGADASAAETGQPSPTPAGKIYDANGPMLTALAVHDGCQTRRLAVADSVPEFLAALSQQITDWHPDLIVTSGGISHGKYEVVRLAIEKLAADAGSDFSRGDLRAPQVWFGHVTQQPGGPQGLALLERDGGAQLPVICLPGNPVSTLISYHLLLRPAFAVLRGRPLPDLLQGQLVLPEGNTIEAPAGKTQYRRASLTCQGQPGGAVLPCLYPDAATGSHLLHRAAAANALVELEPGVVYRGGETVNYLNL